MHMIMHTMVFVPAVVFGVVAAMCWGFCAVADQLDRRPGWPPVAAPGAALPAGRGFRPVVIQGGLAAAAISSFRVAQTPLGSGGAAGAQIRAARSYGG